MDTSNSCFVIMPFSDTEHGPDRRKITESQWTYIFEHWIKKAVESFQPAKFVCKRSPAKPGNFVKGIVADLDASDLVIADLTGAKPNVYYELGIRHALRTGTIVITQHFDALPSDLRNYFVFEYSYSDKAHEYGEYFARFEKKMHETMQAWADADDPSDSPVSDFLGIINLRIEKELEQEKEVLKNILIKQKPYFIHNFDVCEIILGWLTSEQPEEPKENEKLFVMDVFAIDIIFSRLIGYNWKHLKADSLDPLEELVIKHRRLFNEAATIWKAHYNGPQDPQMTALLIEMLQDLSGRKTEFNNVVDQLIAAVDTVKLIKTSK